MSNFRIALLPWLLSSNERAERPVPAVPRETKNSGPGSPGVDGGGTRERKVRTHRASASRSLGLRAVPLLPVVLGWTEQRRVLCLN